jgi:hypothetical protein
MIIDEQRDLENLVGGFWQSFVVKAPEVKRKTT